MITTMVQYLYDGSASILPLPVNVCNTVYANDPQFIKALNDPQSTFMCVDIQNLTTPETYTPGQYGFPQKLVLESTTCGVALANWFTKFKTPFPYQDLVCNTKLLETGIGLNLTTEVVSIGRQFSVSSFKAGQDDLDEMPWFVLNRQVASYLNNTRLTLINNLQVVSNQVHDDTFYNSNAFEAFEGQSIETIAFTGTNNWVFQYNIDPATSTYPLGYAPIFLNFLFELQPTMAVNKFVLKRSLMAVLSIYGGLMVAIYFICWVLTLGCRNYDAEDELFHQLYTLSPEEQMQGDG